MDKPKLAISIVLDKTLPIGVASNVSSIVFGQLVLMNPSIYKADTLIDKLGARHASINSNVVILKANSSIQITNHILKHLPELQSIDFAVFTNWGRNVSNGYDAYKDHILQSDLHSLEPVGLGLVGNVEIVKSLTKKFSYYSN